MCYLRDEHLIADSLELSFPPAWREMFEIVAGLSLGSLTESDVMCVCVCVCLVAKSHVVSNSL